MCGSSSKAKLHPLARWCGDTRSPSRPGRFLLANTIDAITMATRTRVHSNDREPWVIWRMTFPFWRHWLHAEVAFWGLMGGCGVPIYGQWTWLAWVAYYTQACNISLTIACIWMPDQMCPYPWSCILISGRWGSVLGYGDGTEGQSCKAKRPREEEQASWRVCQKDKPWHQRYRCMLRIFLVVLYWAVLDLHAFM